MSVLIVCSGGTGYSVAQALQGAAEQIVSGREIQVLRLDGSVRSDPLENISDDVRIAILCITDASLEEGLINYVAGFLWSGTKKTLILLVDVDQEVAGAFRERKTTSLIRDGQLNETGLHDIFAAIADSGSPRERGKSVVRLKRRWPDLISPLRQLISLQPSGLEVLATAVRSRAKVPGSDEILRINGVATPGGYRKLKEPLESFFGDQERGCSDYDKNVFIMTRFLPGNKALESIDKMIRSALKSVGFTGHRADDRVYPDDRNLWDNVCTYMVGCKYGISVLEDIVRAEFNPNVALEYGFMRALGKPTLLLKEHRMRPRAAAPRHKLIERCS